MLSALVLAGVTILRMATIAPDGTLFTRELRSFARDVEQGTEGRVQVKWFVSGIAGDDLQMLSRMERGQLDGAASPGVACFKLAPAMRVTRVPGLFHSRGEAAYTLQQLRPTLDAEYNKAGYELIAMAGMGPEVMLTRAPLSTFEEMKKLRLWRWDIDQPGVVLARAMGLNVVPMGYDQATRAFDERTVDAIMAFPTAALAMQWSTHAKYLVDLPFGFYWGCLLLSTRAMGKLPIEQQRVVRAAGAKLAVRMEQSGAEQDAQLLGGLFAKQGLKTVPVSAGLRSEFLSVAREARDRAAGTIVPRELLDRVLAILADYRQEHGHH